MKQVIRLDSGVHTLHEVTAADKKYIENLYEDVKKTIQKKMTALGIRNNPDTAVSDSLKKFQLRELEKSIDRDLAEIRTSTQAHIIGSMNTISQAVAQSNADWLASLGLNFSFSVASVPPDVVANLVSGKVYADNWQFSKRIWGDYRSSKGDVSNIVARGIAENKSAFEIAQDLEKYVSPSAAKPWDWSKVYPGCKKKIDYNAQRLARTLSAHAYQQSVIETAKRNPFTTRVEWHSAMVEGTCPICEARNGQIYELGKVPMDHPNGLCCIYPVLDKSLEEISNILADWVNGEGDADMNGRIDKYISYLGYDPGKVAADTLKAGSMLKGLDKIGGSGIMKMGKISNAQQEIVFNSVIKEDDRVEEIRKQYSELLGVPLNNFVLDGIKNSDVIEPFFKRLAKIKERTGMTFPKIAAVNIIDGDETCIAGFKPYENCFYISSRFFNDKETLENTLKNWAKSGMLPKQARSIAYLAEHEAAHIRIPNSVIENETAKELWKKRKLINDNDSDMYEFFADAVAIFKVSSTYDDNIQAVIDYLIKEGVKI